MGYRWAAERYAGARRRSWATAAGTISRAASISAGVVRRPRLKRTLARASGGGRPIAVSTWEGSMAPEEQAAPVEQARPLRSRAMTNASPSIPEEVMLLVLGVRGAAAAFVRAAAVAR